MAYTVFTGRIRLCLPVVKLMAWTAPLGESRSLSTRCERSHRIMPPRWAISRSSSKVMLPPSLRTSWVARAGAS